MRIALVHSFYSGLRPSGENRVVEDQAAALRSAGHDVLLAARYTDNDSAGWLYPLRTSFRVATGWGANPKKILRDFEPDIVHIHNTFPNISTSWLSTWETPIVVSLHNYRLFCSNGLFYRDNHNCFECPQSSDFAAVRHACYRDSRIATLPVALGRSAARRDLLGNADAVVMTSEIADQTLTHFLGPSLRRELIPNFGPGEAESPKTSQVRSGWVALGRFSAEKGFLELIDAWPDHHQLTIIGSGDLQDLVLKAARLRNISVEAPMPIEDLRKRLPHFQGLVLPSRWLEVAPQVVVEAMRVGLPIVAYEGNGVASLVTEAKTGVSYGDGGSLGAALTSVAVNLDEMSLTAVDFYKANWSSEVWLARMTNLYEDLRARTGTQ